MCYHDNLKQPFWSWFPMEVIISKQRKQGEEEETREKDHVRWGHGLKEVLYSYISWRGLEDCKKHYTKLWCWHYWEATWSKGSNKMREIEENMKTKLYGLQMKGRHMRQKQGETHSESVKDDFAVRSIWIERVLLTEGN